MNPSNRSGSGAHRADPGPARRLREDHAEANLHGIAVALGVEKDHICIFQSFVARHRSRPIEFGCPNPPSRCTPRATTEQVNRRDGATPALGQAPLGFFLEEQAVHVSVLPPVNRCHAMCHFDTGSGAQRVVTKRK